VLAIIIGRSAGHRLPRAALRRAAGLVFCAFAVFSAVHGL
jgi:putative Ca2+/H+ antiporter (TMEM165/GDT1 family)